VPEVFMRCDSCARDLGKAAPVLAACGHHPSGWSVAVLRRLPRRRTLDAQPPYRRVVSRMALDGRGIELHCRRCHRRPRVGRRELYALAEQALAAGRSDAYV
jgi:hypothetical protein